MSSEEGLGFLRVISTLTILKRMLGGDSELPIAVGDWVELVVSPNLSKPGPTVWSLQLRGDQFIGDGREGLPTRGKLISMSRLASASQPIPPHQLGASVPASLATGGALKARYSLLNVARPVTPADTNNLLRQWSQVWRLGKPVARDVGQASFNVIYPHCTKPGPTLYFDVGQPIWSHLHNLPPGFFAPCPEKGVVVLSHWDTDHYAYGRQHPEFHKLHWIAPAQRSVGPNAHTFARKLHSVRRLQLVGTGKSTRHRRGARIIRCFGTSVNGSGLALHLRAVGRDILFTGDADYHEIPSMRGIQLSGLQVPHHGGRLSGLTVVPQAFEPSRAVVSCGLPNRYGHPNAATLSNHRAANWNVKVTATQYADDRGDRPL